MIPGCHSPRLRSPRMAWHLVPDLYCPDKLSRYAEALKASMSLGDIPLHNIMNAYHIPPQYFASACSALSLDMVPEEFRDYSMCMTSSGNPETELGDVLEEHLTFAICHAIVKQSGKLFDVRPNTLRMNCVPMRHARMACRYTPSPSSRRYAMMRSVPRISHLVATSKQSLTPHLRLRMCRPKSYHRSSTRSLR